MRKKNDDKPAEDMKEKVERRELNNTLKGSLVYYNLYPRAFASIATNNVMDSVLEF